MISVVIPTHNRADLLPRAIKSVQTQTLKDLEIIIVSDGSEDNTREVVENLAEDDNRIKFIEYYPAKGGNIARNIGIENATGEYVAFLDDDDEFMPEKLEKQLAEFSSNSKCGLVYTGVNIIYVNEKIEYTFIGKKRGDLKIDILLDNYIGTTSTVMVRTKILKDVGMFDTNLRALQDFELWIRVCQYCDVSVVPEILINYYNYTGSTQVSAFTQKYVDSFTYIYNKHEKLFLKLTEAQKREKEINVNMLLANKAMRNNNKKLARAYARKALKIGFNKGAVLYWLLSFTSFRTVLKMRSIK